MHLGPFKMSVPNNSMFRCSDIFWLNITFAGYFYARCKLPEARYSTITAI